MSDGVAVVWASAMESAEQLRAMLGGWAERIEIAGSLRRNKAVVHDIELVAIPRFLEEPDGMFATVQADLLERRVADLLERGVVQARQVENHRADGTIVVQTKLGPAFKALVFEGIPVDLFIVRPPATWGVIFGLRTGPGDWNIRLVIDCQPFFRNVAGGQVLYMGKPVPTPEEADFFAAIGQPWVEPSERSVDRVAVRRPTVTEGEPV